MVRRLPIVGGKIEIRLGACRNAPRVFKSRAEVGFAGTVAPPVANNIGCA